MSGPDSRPICGVVSWHGRPYPGGMQRFARVKAQPVGGTRDKSVLRALIGYDLPGGSGIFPSAATLAEDTEWNKRSVREALRSLQESGWIAVRRHRHRVRGRQSSNSYRIRQAGGQACPDFGFSMK